MPTLGFLKKIRSKEPSSSKDPTSPTTDSRLTKATSKELDSQLSKSSSSTIPQDTTPNSTTATTVNKQVAQAASQDSSMNQGGHQQPYTAGQDHQNLPSINNLINPPQHDGAGQSYNSQQQVSADSMASNGGHSDQVQSVTQPQVTQPSVPRTTKGKYTLSDFEILRTLGTGSFGRVHLVQSKHNQRFYAVKVLKKQQVVKMKQVEHTNDERKMLQEVKHPFLITLWGTFQDSRNLYMVMDFVEGGELFSLLRKSQVSIWKTASSVGLY